MAYIGSGVGRCITLGWLPRAGGVDVAPRRMKETLGADASAAALATPTTTNATDATKPKLGRIMSAEVAQSTCFVSRQVFNKRASPSGPRLAATTHHDTEPDDENANQEQKHRIPAIREPQKRKHGYKPASKDDQRIDGHEREYTREHTA